MRYLITLFTIALMTLAASAEVVDFKEITSNAPNRHDIAGQLSMDVTQKSMYEVSILFENIGSDASSISSIYFGGDEQNVINLGIDSILSSSGRVFFDLKKKTTPPNPPGDKNWISTLTSVSSKPPRSWSGINPGESLELKLTYDSDLSFMNLLESGDVQVAMHVISIGQYSDTFVNVPEPSSLILFGVAAAGIAFVRKRFIA